MKGYFPVAKKLTLVLLLGFIFSIHSQAQAAIVFSSPNVRVDDTGALTSVQNRPSIATDTDGNIYVVWADNRNGSGYEVYFTKSANSGASFGTNVRVNEPGSSSLWPFAPSIATDTDGNIYVAWADERSGDYDAYLAKSADGGVSFGVDIRINDHTAGDQGLPSIATDTDGNIYVAWLDERNGNYDIYFAKSTDGGANFGSSLRVDDTGASTITQHCPVIAVASDGTIYVAWRDYGNGDHNIYFAKSTDGGASFDPDVRVNNSPTSPAVVDFLSIAVASDGNIYVAWQGGATISLARSTNGGLFFDPEIRVPDDGGASGDGRAFNPSIAVDTAGNIYAAWYDDRNGYINCDIHLSRSTDSGLSFGSDIRVDDTTSSTTMQTYPAIAVAQNGDIYIAWQDARNGNWDIYFARGVDIDAWVLNMSDMQHYGVWIPYSSTGAVASQMILNYIRVGAGEPILSQDEIYAYARGETAYPYEDLTPDEVDKALGHFDPYDYLVSNWADDYDSLPDGNPYQGYNFSVSTYDPNTNPDAFNEYMRDICHWMAYTVTKENWWEDGELVAKPNTPVAIPIYGSYDYWVIVSGCVTSENPAPTPHTDPWNTPDFTVYGLWMKSPVYRPGQEGIGRHSYKTAAECRDTYFKPLATGDSYDGLLVKVSAKCVFSPDLNIDGNINFIDFAVLGEQWHQPPGVPSADIAPPPNGDGIVNFLDLQTFCENWLVGAE